MVPDEPRQILMCVSPGDDYEAALDYVVAEAARRRCGIHLALVVRPLVVGTPDVPSLSLLDAQWRKHGTDFLAECQRRVSKAVGPDIRVSTEIMYGLVVPALVDVSQERCARRDAAPADQPCSPRAHALGHERRCRTCACARRGRARCLA